MVTALDYKSLAAGKVTNAKTTLYTVPAATQTAIQSMTWHNTGAGNNLLDIWFKLLGGTVEVHIIGITLESGDHLTLSEVGTFTAADFIEAQATNTNEVEYAITGAEAT